tara:strand:+ start:164 stop:397 length:234 start_codon:yes stop_codon:yes gene_type:complete
MLTTTNMTYLVFALTLLVMIWYLTNRGRANLAKARADAEPAVAGSDELDGAAKNPEQFDEPDEEALEEMAALLGEEE